MRGALGLGDVALFDGVYELSCDYCRPGKTFGIIDWAEDFVEQGGLDDFEFDNRMGVLCDPQTSGGLLVAIPPEQAQKFEAEFQKRMSRPPTRIGEFTIGKPGHIYMTGRSGATKSYGTYVLIELRFDYNNTAGHRRFQANFAGLSESLAGQI